MKSMPSIVYFVACLFLSACQSDKKEIDTGKNIGALYLSDATPNRGSNLQIVYSLGTDVAEADVKGYYYYLVNTDAYPQDLFLTVSSGVVKATVSIPDSATAIAFNIKIGETYDTNDKKGYVMPLFNEENKMVPGAKASKAYFYSSIGNRFGLEMQNDSVLAMIQTDLEKHPDIQSSWADLYAKMLYRFDVSKGENYIAERVAFYLEKPTLSEDDYLALISLQNTLRHTAKADSLRKVAIEKYPQGSMALQKYFIKLRQTKNLVKKEEMLAQFDSKFGKNVDARYEDAIDRIMASAYMWHDKFDKSISISQKISNKQIKATLYNSIALKMAEKEDNMKMAGHISKKSLELVDAARKDTAEKPNRLTVNQYLANLNRSYQMFADTYAYILSEQGKIEEALVYQEKAVGEGENSEINERYIQYLLAAGNSEKAQQLAVGYIKNNVATAKIKDYFEKAYVNNNKSEKGLEEKLVTLEKEAHEKALAEVKKQMLNEPAAEFVLMDLEGNEISLASLKDKTVILDFWATWCGPCKASFPGMQKAVEKYQDDPKVAFFFVNTMEAGLTLEARNKKVGAFIQQNEYNFHVLLDEPVKKGSSDFKTATDYGILGIPAKIIIGPRGNIKFKKVGYGGNNKRMLEEIEMMIELSQIAS